MFKNEVSATPFTTEVANDAMSRIYGDRFMLDNSFLATMRALLYNRIPEEDHIAFKISSSSSQNMSVSEIYNRNPQIGAPCGIALHYFNNMNAEVNAASFKKAVDCFIDSFDGYKEHRKIREFYRQAFNVACFINEDTKSVVVFVEQMDYRRYHYLQCAILPMFVWYFDKQKGITADEKALVDSLQKRDPNVYLECLEKIAATFDFRAKAIRDKLAGFETAYIKEALAGSEQRYTNIVNTITRLNDEINSKLEALNSLNIEIRGMQDKIASGDNSSEIMDYFLSHKGFTLIEARGSTIDFIIDDKIEYFDPEEAESAINCTHGYLYTCGDDTSRADREMLFKAIFLDGTVNVRVCAAFRLSISGGVSARSHYSFGEEFNKSMPHPHIDEYSCMGDYTRIVNELMQNHNYIMSLEQCIASTRSLNFSDSTVMSHFVRTLFGSSSHNRCIELPDGRVVRPTEAIEWLKSNGDDGE